MQANRHRDTKPEIRLRVALQAAGLRFFKNRRLLATRRIEVDVIFPRARLAVFIDGCFWHGCPQHATVPITNRDWWRDKLDRNRHRDRETDEALTSASWTVLRLWAHEPVHDMVSKVSAQLADLRQGRTGPGYSWSPDGPDAAE